MVLLLSILTIIDPITVPLGGLSLPPYLFTSGNMVLLALFCARVTVLIRLHRMIREIESTVKMVFCRQITVSVWLFSPSSV